MPVCHSLQATTMVVEDMAGEKRSRCDVEVGRRSKHAKLEDDRVAAASAGANLIQANGKTCTHEVAWPPAEQGSHLPPQKPATAAAKEYPFPLDPFQQTAINGLEKGRTDKALFLVVTRKKQCIGDVSWR